MTRASTAGLEERSVDGFLGGRVTLVQPRKGHRAGLDAALLQALVPSGDVGRAVDLGAGVGTVAFCIAARAPGMAVVAVERDPALIACGHDALALPANAAFAAQVRLLAADVSDPRTLRDALGLAGNPPDWVLMNPPFDPEGRVSQSPDGNRRAAHVAAEGLLESWLATAAALLGSGGRLALVHRADALPDVMAALSGFGDIRVLPAHPSESAPATRILVTARLGRRGPFTLLPGLVLHRPGGGWTPRADAILRGDAELAL